jgi:probable phosphoglycerate mutase
MNRIYLVRHGENQANLTKEFSHRLVDYPLNAKGRSQAQQTAEYFADKQIHGIYTSPLRRAYETAEVIGERIGRPVTAMENFREVNVGLLEKQAVSAENWRLHNEIILGWLNGNPERRFPEGENYEELCQRMRVGMAEIIQGRQGENILLVGHGGIFTLTVPDLCPGIDIMRLVTQENHNCSISEILVDQVGKQLRGELVQWAYLDHLSGEAAQFTHGTPRAGELA